jgi:hypothetical protein
MVLRVSELVLSKDRYCVFGLDENEMCVILVEHVFAAALQCAGGNVVPLTSAIDSWPKSTAWMVVFYTLCA